MLITSYTFLSHGWWMAQSECPKLALFDRRRDFRSRCLRWLFWGGTEVDLNFVYLVSFDSEEFRVPGATAILGLAVVEDKGFVAFLKHLLNAIRWGFLAIGPSLKREIEKEDLNLRGVIDRIASRR
jgi:hypothetical protein